MVHIIVRHTITDYATWHPAFDADDTRRRAAGSTGVNQVYRDTDNPNVLTLVLEWDTAEKAQAFSNNPALGEVMQKAGVVGMPTVLAIVSHA